MTPTPHIIYHFQQNTHLYVIIKQSQFFQISQIMEGELVLYSAKCGNRHGLYVVCISYLYHNKVKIYCAVRLILLEVKNPPHL